MLKTLLSRQLTTAQFIVALVLLAVTASAQVFPTVGVYDESTDQTNAVDFVAEGSTLNFDQFKKDIATAFSNDMGGVYQCDEVGQDSGPYTFSYGVSQMKLLTVTGSDNSIGVTWGGSDWDRSISGLGLWVSIKPKMTFNFPSKASGEAVVKFGLTIPSFSYYPRNVIATATFSDGSKATAKRFISEAVALGDTFFGFAAPDGQTIASITFTNDAQPGMSFDDIGFITAKFPSLTIAGLGTSQFRVSWPTNAMGFLECATNFPATGWTPVTNSPVIMGDKFTVTLDTDSQRTFFRLRGP
ncbi:hypothetical protein [Pedosphaera parvula]|uniref:Uncharacterized protein n=1 Tax=Pedosphaera parvula (strain Ellin514) TaxID=320771 RepID=B9XA22_PEDPL|nr:hypothetical protein [Pedosphaera parvula]EEF63363.1 hypothetical protein Cflav_PD5998 [Pedosphaera parvula Ellin514]